MCDRAVRDGGARRHVLLGAGLGRALRLAALCGGVALAGCDGLGGRSGSGYFFPPDPNFAANSFFGIEFVNDFEWGRRIDARGVTDYDMRQWVSPAAGGDQRGYWGDFQQRFAMVGIHNDAFHHNMGVDVNISQDADPTARVWQGYWWGQTTAADGPSLGFAQNAALVADRFGHIYGDSVTNMQFGVSRSPAHTFQSAAGVATPTGHNPQTYVAHSRDGDLPYTYALSTDESQTKIWIERFDAVFSEKRVTVGVPLFGISQIREGTDVLGSVPGDVIPNGADVSDALVLAGGHHLLVAVSNLMDSGGGHFDDCVRVFDFYDVGTSGFTPTLQGHADYCFHTQDVYCGSLGQALNGDVYVLMECSGPGMPISMCYGKWIGPQASLQPVRNIDFGANFGTIRIQRRVGDYTTLGADYLEATKVIGVGQVAESDPTYWKTRFERIP